MPVIQERIKPTVHVGCAEDAPQEVLRQLQYGMEEEGIPWEAAAGTGDALSLAWEAAGAPGWRWESAWTDRRWFSTTPSWSVSSPCSVFPPIPVRRRCGRWGPMRRGL